MWGILRLLQFQYPYLCIYDHNWDQRWIKQTEVIEIGRNVLMFSELSSVWSNQINKPDKHQAIVNFKKNQMSSRCRAAQTLNMAEIEPPATRYHRTGWSQQDCSSRPNSPSWMPNELLQQEPKLKTFLFLQFWCWAVNHQALLVDWHFALDSHDCSDFLAAPASSVWPKYLVSWQTLWKTIWWYLHPITKLCCFQTNWLNSEYLSHIVTYTWIYMILPLLFWKRCMLWIENTHITDLAEDKSVYCIAVLKRASLALIMFKLAFRDFSKPLKVKNSLKQKQS